MSLLHVLQSVANIYDWCLAACTYWISNGWYLKSEQRAKQYGIFSSLKCLNTSDGRGHVVGGGGVGAEVLLLHKVTRFRVNATCFLPVIPIPNININVMSFVCNWLWLYFLQRKFKYTATVLAICLPAQIVVGPMTQLYTLFETY